MIEPFFPMPSLIMKNKNWFPPFSCRFSSSPSSPTMPWWTGLSITLSWHLSRRDLRRLTSPRRNFWWFLRQAQIIFHDSFLCPKGEVCLISGAFEPPCGFPGRLVLFWIIFSPYWHPFPPCSILHGDGMKQNWAMNAYTAIAAEDEILIICLI